VPESSLRPLLAPHSVVVMGASNRETNLGLRFSRGLQRHGFAGTACVVNRRGEDVDGLAGYASLGEAPPGLELAVISLNADAVPGAITECGDHGISAAVVFSSGFAEVGGPGVERQRDLLKRAAAGGVRLMGPNCVGFANVVDNVCAIASGFAFRETFKPGDLSIITQSGGVAGLLAERAMDIGIGLSHVISTGNEADVTAAELVSYLLDEGSTQSLAIYLEAVRRPQELADALRSAVAAGVGVTVFKAGAGRSTAAAAAAHTGSLVGDDATFDAFCHRTGVVRVHELDDLFLVASIAARLKATGPRIGVLSVSGGAAVATADACERIGLELPPLAEETGRRLAEVVPGFASTQNPIDISGAMVVAMEQFHEALRILTTASEFDATVLVQTVHPTAVAEQIAEVIVERTDPARTVVMWGGGSQTLTARVRLRDAGFAVSESVSACAAGLRAAMRPLPEDPPRFVWPEGDAPGLQRPSETLARLASVGVPIADMVTVKSAAGASGAAEKLGFPVVMKADIATLTHKTEQQAVLLGLASREEVVQAFEDLAARGLAGDGVLVQSAVRGQRELLVSAMCDPVFGLVLVIGFGGVLTESIARAAIVLPPLTVSVIHDGIDRAGLGALLADFRGSEPVDATQLTALAQGLLTVAAEVAGLRHLELNPAIVADDGRVLAVDALIDAER
jgi:acyl-CoA synthetase (NDP forming)